MKNEIQTLALDSYSDDAENFALDDEFNSDELPVHQATSIFPDMTAVEFEELKADIAKNGLRLPILVFRNQIIDGRQRVRACKELGIAPRYQAVHQAQKSIPEYIVSMNLKRRHLNDSQRAMIANSLAKLGRGQSMNTAQAVKVDPIVKTIFQSI